MTVTTTDLTHTTAWWARHGFTADPFALREAGQESRLAEYFVPGPDYDRIKDLDRSALVFAARGSGKSAYRMMIQSVCRPADPAAAVLAIPYVNFDSVLAGSGGLQAVTLQQHVATVVGAGAQVLLHEFLVRPGSFDKLPPASRSLFRWLAEHYAPRSAHPVQLLRTWATLGKPLPVDMQDVYRELAAGRLPAFLLAKPLADCPPAQFLAGFLMSEPAPLAASGPLPCTAPLHALLDLVRWLGIDTLCVLVDGLDEMGATAANPAAIADLLEPLLVELHLLETPGLIFKLFLPAAAVNPLRDRRRVRLDRLHVFTLSWSDADLVTMLRQRLASFNHSGIDSLGAIAEQSLADRIDRELVELSYGSPRTLLILGHLLLAAHGQAAPDELRLTQADWERARSDFKRLYGAPVPNLRVDLATAQVYVGDQELRQELTALEAQLLIYLYEARGQLVSKDAIAHALYQSADGVSSDTLDSLVRRLRGKIERYPARPVYLVTVRGQGYRLEHAV